MGKFDYAGKRALVVGGASGMGAATARLLGDLGAEVYIADVNDATVPAVKALRMDLRDKSAIDGALDEVGGPIHALFSCAGVSDDGFSPADVVTINFIGQRYLIERAIEKEMLPTGSSIGMIASIGGIGWDRHLSQSLEFLDIADFAAARSWVEQHPPAAPYVFSKEVMITYCGKMAVPFAHRGIRINVTGPGPTMTPLMEATPSWGGFQANEYSKHMNSDGSTADDQAGALVVLGLDAASHVNGQILYVDGGYVAGGRTRAIDAALVNAMAPPLS